MHICTYRYTHDVERALRYLPSRDDGGGSDRGRTPVGRPAEGYSGAV